MSVPGILVATVLTAATLKTAIAQDTVAGKVIVEVKEFTSEVELKPKIENQLKAGGIEWGMSEGQLVITLVNKQFIKAEISNFTRYGEKKELELPVGQYTVTCVGISPETAFSIEKMLSKSAYFNLDRLSFPVTEGNTTMLEIHPVIRAHNTMFVKFFQPEILVKVVEDGAVTSEAVVNSRTAESIAWDNYTGPLKFQTDGEPKPPRGKD